MSTDQTTELHVRFEPVGAETRVTVEHLGWDTIPLWTLPLFRSGAPPQFPTGLLGRAF